MMTTLPGHSWWYSAIDDKDHLFPTAVAPDDEGVITTACGKELMAFRVVAEERHLYCVDCLVEVGKVEAPAIEAAYAKARERFLDGSA